MISTHKLKAAIEEIKDISKTELALYTVKGKIVAATFEPEQDMEKTVVLFSESMAESQQVAGCHFFKVYLDQELEYVLLAKATSEDAYMVGRLAACQIRNLVASYNEKFDRNKFMQSILLGNMLVVDMYNTAKKMHIDQAERTVFVIDVDGKKEEGVFETVKNLFVTPGKDFVTEIDETSIVVIKETSSIPDDSQLENQARMLVDNIQSEVMVKVRVGYGNRVMNLHDIAKSFQEAKMALEVAKIFYAGKDIAAYKYLGIGRLVYQLPMSLCEMYIKEVFGDNIPDVFDEETQITIQKFFENNLNISETARQLYLHRNTLVYRLERLEKNIGLDIRRFDDAMTFKIAMMVLSHMRYNENKLHDIR